MFNFAKDAETILESARVAQVCAVEYSNGREMTKYLFFSAKYKVFSLSFYKA